LIIHHRVGTILTIEEFIVDEVEVKEEKDALQMELEVLNEFIGMRNPKNKKIVALAKRLYLEKDHFAQKRLLRDIIWHKDPLGFTQRCIDNLYNLKDLIPDLIAEGHHGMIIVDGEIHPITVEAPAHWLVRNWKWDPDDEFDIQKKMVEKYLKEHGLERAFCKVMLFSDFGFSGTIQIIEVFKDEKAA